MSLDVYFKADLQRNILAGIMLAARTSREFGPGRDYYLDGVLAMAEHQALSFGLDWSAMVGEATKLVLGNSQSKLLENTNGS